MLDSSDHNFFRSSLRSVIEKPPIGGKELLPLTPVQLSGFKLHPGPVRKYFCIFVDYAIAAAL